MPLLDICEKRSSKARGGMRLKSITPCRDDMLTVYITQADAFVKSSAALLELNLFQ